ncbi:UPF0488 protein C8orf33 homolog [Antechinus flavipes]|uniref:UPF0488 protein C8orf33 homolog n=1 Tax=Antechinus flavipes TaxID=38775 RepID=UPI002235B736|nr:UPF0488 protein C8orf33 homolog [Antechinus flavipes]
MAAPRPKGLKGPERKLEAVGGGRGANKKGKKQPPRPGTGSSALGHKRDTEELAGLPVSRRSEDGEQDEQLRLQRELDWCVEQLELGLKTQKSNPKQAEQVARAVKTLRSQRAELPKKRQVMRSLFGDYRARMEEDRKAALKAMEAAARSARVIPVEEAIRRKSSRICRHRPGGRMNSVSLPEEEFKFNFILSSAHQESP